MVQAVPQLMTLEEFLDWYPDGYGRYELWNGVVIEMQPTGPHEQVGDFLGLKLGVEIDRLTLSYFIPRQAIVKPVDNEQRRGDGQGSVGGGKATGSNPTDRAKSGTKRRVLTDGRGVPLRVALEGANRHDMKMTEATLESQQIVPPDTDAEWLRNLCLDKGYDYEEVRQILIAWRYVEHIPPKDESKRIIHDIPNYRARRWVVERTYSWMNRFRRLLIRWEKKPENYLAMIHLSFAAIAVRAVQVFG